MYFITLGCQDVSRWIGLASGVMNSLEKNIWRYLCRRTKQQVFKALIIPVLLYGSETWKLFCALESHLNAFCNRSLCQIIGYSWRVHISNQQLHCETGTGLFETALGEEGQWDYLGRCGLGRSIKPNVRSKRWGESRLGGLP